MSHHSEVLRAVLPPPEACGVVLDCAAGIGTMAISLASLGYTVEGSDLAEASIDRARREAAAKGLNINFRVDDIRKLEKAPKEHYGAVMALDNVIPHLGDMECQRETLEAMLSRLRPGGSLLLSIRDYEKLIKERPALMPPTFHGKPGSRRIVHELWDWHDERCYTFHLYITRQTDNRWDVLHFTGTYHAVTTDEIAQMLDDIGCEAIEVMPPEQTGFHQPLIRARRKMSEIDEALARLEPVSIGEALSRK